MRNSPHFLSLVSAATLVAASSASAAVVASSNFDSIPNGGTGTAGWSIYNSVAGATISNPSDTTLTPAGGTAADALAYTYTGTGAFTGVASNFGPISLNDGDKIILTLDFRFTSAAPSSGATFLLFLGNQATPGTLAATDKSYGLIGSTNNAPGNAFRYDAGTSNSMIAGTDRTSVGTASATAQNIGDTLRHTLTFSIERSGLDYILSGGVDGNSVTHTQVGANQFSFNTMGLGIVTNTSTTPAAIAIDNVTLTSVPEPSAALLGGLGLLGLLRRRRA